MHSNLLRQRGDRRGGHSETPRPSCKVGMEWGRKRTVIQSIKNLAMADVPLSQWDGWKDCIGPGKGTLLLCREKTN